MVIFNPDIHHRQSLRLQDFDYSSAGAYFVTICAYQREWLFGNIEGGEMKLNEMGEIVAGEWIKTSSIRAEIEIDEWVVMPNHVHGIVWIRDPVGACGARPDRSGCGVDPDPSGRGFI